MARAATSPRRPPGPRKSQPPPAPDIALAERPLGYVDIDRLTPYEGNARRHSKRQLEALGESLRAAGPGAPIAIWQDGLILAGHGRVEAARAVGIARLPAIDLSDLTFDAARRYCLADNKIADLGAWDADLLKAELAALAGGHTGEAAVAALGFTSGELAKMLPAAPVDRADPSDTTAAADLPAVAALGDLWFLGPHKLACGDMLDPDVWALFGAIDPALVVTDPPYGVSYANKAEDLSAAMGQSKARESSTIANDDLSGADFAVFIRAVGAMVDSLAPTATVYVFAPGGDLAFEFGEAFRWDVKLCWVKHAMVLGRADYNYRHEICFYGAGDTPFGGPPNASDLWTFDKPHRSKLHPTMKPVALIEQCIRHGSAPGDLVIEPFGGSGSTLIAADNLGRVANLVELSARYCDVILRRYRDHTGVDPVRSDGQSLSVLESAA